AIIPIPVRPRLYATEVEGSLFLFESHEEVQGVVGLAIIRGDVALIRRSDKPAGDLLHLVSISGVDVLRFLQVLPDFRIRVMRDCAEPSETNSFVTYRGCPTFKILGVFRGVVMRRGILCFDSYGKEHQAVKEARAAGLI